MYAKASIQLLSGEYSEELFAFAKKHGTGLDVYYKIISQEFIAKAHSSGIKVNAYVVDKKEDAERLVGYELDYITTNILI